MDKPAESKHPCVLIVGAGPTGLTAALELTRRGVSCLIIDQRPGPTQTSNALGVQARTLEIWENQGVVDTALLRGQPVHQMHFFYSPQHDCVLTTDILPTPYPYILALPQSQTEQILGAALKKLGVEVAWNTTLTQLQKLPENCWQAELQKTKLANLTQTEVWQGQWLLACDGGHSRVRALVQQPFVGEDLPQYFFMVDVEIDSEGQLQSDAIYAFLYRGLVAIFPLSRSQFRVICEVTHDLRFRNNKTPTLENFKQLLLERCPLTLTLKNPTWFSSFHTHAKSVDQMRHDTLFFVGDAAHIHSPIGGQGMNTGIQDAFNLAWKLACVIKKQNAPDALLDSYHQERYPVLLHILQRTTSMTKLLTWRMGWLTKLRNFFIVQALGLRAIRTAMMLEASELSIHYRNSSLSKQYFKNSKNKNKNKNKNKKYQKLVGHETGQAGHEWYTAAVLAPQAGERMPLLPAIRTKLSGMHGQLFVFALARCKESDDGLLADFLAQFEPSTAGRNQHACNSQDDIVTFSISVFDSDDYLAQQFAANPYAIYWVRPDGYVGYRSDTLDSGPLQDYLRQFGFLYEKL